MDVKLTVNSVEISADIEARLTLADFLREYASARSVHLGCEHGVCGSCTVLVEDKTVRSCITLAASIDGAQVYTLEGLSEDPVICSLKESFHREHALQCGYCTPAMLIVARDLVKRCVSADDSQIREGLEGQICRCTGYAGIVRGIKTVLDDQA